MHEILISSVLELIIKDEIRIEFNFIYDAFSNLIHSMVLKKLPLISQLQQNGFIFFSVFAYKKYIVIHD